MLRHYMSALNHSDGTEAPILSAMREVVLRLDDFDEEHDYFIEMLKREELYDFIRFGAAVAGHESDEAITEEWREW